MAPSGIGRPVSLSQSGQTISLVRESCLVDDQAGVEPALGHPGHDLVERDDFDARRALIGGPEAEQQVCRGAVTGDGDGRPVEIGAAVGEHERAAAPAERAPAGQQLIVAEQPRQRCITDLDQVERAVESGRVGDVHVGEGQVDRRGAGDKPVHERVEHEGVVGARGNRQGERHGIHASPARRGVLAAGPV
jgi:hypothetical protein